MAAFEFPGSSEVKALLYEVFDSLLKTKNSYSIQSVRTSVYSDIFLSLSMRKGELLLTSVICALNSWMLHRERDYLFESWLTLILQMCAIPDGDC